jgi:hypothetical protein
MFRDISLRVIRDNKKYAMIALKKAEMKQNKDTNDRVG